MWCLLRHVARGFKTESLRGPSIHPSLSAHAKPCSLAVCHAVCAAIARCAELGIGASSTRVQPGRLRSQAGRAEWRSGQPPSMRVLHRSSAPSAAAKPHPPTGGAGPGGCRYMPAACVLTSSFTPTAAAVPDIAIACSRMHDHFHCPIAAAAAAVPVRAAAMALVVAAAAVGGLLLGLLVAKATQNFFRTQFDPERATLENVRLRAKVGCPAASQGAGMARWPHAPQAASLDGDSLSRRSLPVPFACLPHLLTYLLEPSPLFLDDPLCPAAGDAPAAPAACLQIDELQQLVQKYEPMAYKSERTAYTLAHRLLMAA